MKNWAKKIVLVVSVLVITLGSVTLMTGCKKKEAPATPPAAPVEPNM